MDSRLVAARFRQGWAGRVASLFFVAGGALFLATIPLAPPDARRDLGAAIAVAACVVGVVVWFVPWEKLPTRASLVLVPVAFAMIALGNIVGGSDYFTYGVFFVIAYVWIGLAHRPYTGIVLAPLAAAAYLAPLPWLPDADRAAAAASALLVLPVSVLTGEVLARGIDRQVRTEAALQRATAAADELRQLDALKERFLRAASHELRTPITICRGHLDVLTTNPPENELRQTLDLVTDELHRMSELIDDITSLTDIDDPGSLRLEPVDVPRFLTMVGAKARPLFRERSLLVTDAPSGTVRADQRRLTQALLALLNNAAVHPVRATRVELRALRERDAWRFVVADDGETVDIGPGDPFEPFRHSSSSPGTGLGLAIVRAIAEAHGGSAGFETDGGRGSEFFVRVPA